MVFEYSYWWILPAILWALAIAYFKLKKLPHYRSLPFVFYGDMGETIITVELYKTDGQLTSFKNRECLVQLLLENNK
ncbi:MAG: hypothetical protein V8S95_10630 [Odoribacter sp.]